MNALAQKYNKTSLIARICVGLVCGTVLGIVLPGAQVIALLGELFVGALKGIAPLLVFLLIASSLAQKHARLDRRFGLVVLLYIASTLLASFVAVAGSFLFPQTIVLAQSADVASAAPKGIGEVLRNLLMNAVSNPVASVASANYIGILAWAAMFGLALKKSSSETTRRLFSDVADGCSHIVRLIINLAPFGILGLVFSTISQNGLSVFRTYGSLVLLIACSMAAVVLVVEPLIIWIALRKNPYPLVFRCLRESGITAFFTRSSAANIPINMALCEKLGLDRNFYSVSIPLGATINMDGAAVTIAVMTLAAARTLGISVDVPTALFLSVLATFGACGASGVAGGSLLLIPMACSLFGISDDISMQVVGMGFVIGVVQDSLETALNSSGDAMLTATAEYVQWRRDGRALPKRLGDPAEQAPQEQPS
ncbi:MAG: serine/threonine transporter SstT [Treponemataceae bacterium]|nr:serine/threonine transporter SstT [Treponemataceae bacterium]